MEQFRSIEEILSGISSLTAFATEVKTDRVLKSTEIEQAIFDDLYSDADELASFEEQGAKKLKSFGSLVNDVFQSVYGLRPRYTEESKMTALSKEFNKGILTELMADENFTAVKSVCEGKELPAIGATEEFTGKLLENLDGIMDKATGGKGKVDALDKMEQDVRDLSQALSDLVEKYETAPELQKEALERKIQNTANRIASKQEQTQMYAGLIQNSMSRSSADIKRAIATSAEAALERAKDIESAVLAWGDGDPELKKNPVNTEILKRTAKSHKLRYIAKFLGRYKETLKSKRLAGYSYGKGEKYDIEYGNNISRALTSELAMLSSPTLTPLFMRKVMNKGLKQYRKREPEYKGSGDIIVCLDESTSTFGENNAYGMSIAMVLYEICRMNNANFALVHFSSETKVDYFSKDEKVDPGKVLDCAETLLGGGTDFENPLREVFALTASGTLDKPDIVFITDGECDVSDEFLELFDEFKADTGARLTGILLDKGDCFEFSLQKFADVIYRTSELAEDKIVTRLIEERIQ